jgi:hypothetical protein
MMLLPFRFNSRALLARVVYRWHWKLLLLVVALLGGCGLLSGAVPPVWRGPVALHIEADPEATITVDGRAWPFTLYNGTHTIVAKVPDGRVAWTTLDLQATKPITLTLPPGLPEPLVRRVPPAASWADGAWRVQSGAVASTTEHAQRSRVPGQAAPSEPTHTAALTIDSLQPLPTLDAYGGRADQVQVAGSRYEAMYRADEQSSRATGVLEIRGWGDAPETVALSQTLTLVRWSPTGQALLLGEQVGNEAEQLRILRPGGISEPVVAVRGRVRDVVWSPDGSGVVLASEGNDRLSLTLARLHPTVAARVVVEMQATSGDSDPAERNATNTGVAANAALPLPPLHWNRTTLEWIAPDERGQPHLWSASLSSLMPEQQHPLPAAALTRLADGGLRVVAIQDDRVVIGQWQADALVVETTIPDVPAGADLKGQWSPTGSEVMLQRGTDAWLVHLAMVERPATPRSIRR